MAIHGVSNIPNVEVVVPAGNSQATAQPIPKNASPGLILAAGNMLGGILLPIASKGKQFWIKNTATANEILNIYPQVGSQINLLGANTAFQLLEQTATCFIADGNNTWHTVPVLAS